MSLFAIPGAAAGRAQACLNGDEVFKKLSELFLF